MTRAPYTHPPDGADPRSAWSVSSNGVAGDGRVYGHLPDEDVSRSIAPDADRRARSDGRAKARLRAMIRDDDPARS
jgi:hypothetical protein